MKVLLLAEVCNPEWPSLPGFSFYLADSIAQNVDVTIVTHIRNKKNLQKIETNIKEIIYIDNEFIASPLNKLSNLLRKMKIGGWMTNMALRYPTYILFEFLAWHKLKKRISQNEFDLIHRISPVSPTLPSLIAKKSTIPFILGPLNGSLPWPQQFTDAIKKEREFIVHIRNAYKFLPYYKSSFQNASRILVAFEHVKKDVPQSEHHKFVKYNELGVDTNLYQPSSLKKDKSQCDFLFVGRLVPYKGANVVINAFVKSKLLRDKHRLIIVGDGPEKAFLQKLINDNDLQDCVELLGWKTQTEVAKIMQASDVFVFPTIREVGGNVIIEALSAGLPCVVPDYGGPSELVNPNIGIKIPLSDKAEFENQYVAAMESLAQNTELREELSKAARLEAVNNHDWSIRGKKTIQIYNDVLK